MTFRLVAVGLGPGLAVDRGDVVGFVVHDERTVIGVEDDVAGPDTDRNLGDILRSPFAVADVLGVEHRHRVRVRSLLWTGSRSLTFDLSYRNRLRTAKPETESANGSPAAQIGASSRVTALYDVHGVDLVTDHSSLTGSTTSTTRVRPSRQCCTR
ncbi:hypothetical protein CYV19_18940 [Natronobacterium gregoryi SP2]|uniref:Uncharacterized protein n=1 Tax=Natronobacterium gregoryi (strain ATCC 43098 / DSM 3393 / CCM 3738 / CIP 104747 / IAM 13177 / JCM 8860 / NBRC 102187 / NCIMB 2189 / SP2) TaxID=797304 RepID=L9XXG1_NATGS|nr:hypothetical protein C490_13159 [Natronobacterium gregoryi SP2]PLK17727.1 hypothetical protein CYV19_18940 [Natronobacterium gregoryi SP2]